MKPTVIFFLIFIIVILPFIVEATSFTSTTSGNWNDGATWGNASPGVEGTDWPSSTDDAIIAAGDNITLTADRIIISIDVQVSGILSMTDKKLTVNGNFNCDGSITGTADLLMYGRSIGGTGTVMLAGKKFKIYTDVTVIEPGSTLTIADEFKFETDDIDLINYGNLTVTGKITKKNDGNLWINEANSVLNVSGEFLDNNLIEASAVPNTINFNGAGDQKVFTPVSSYHHVQFTGTGKKELQGDVDINGDVTITTAEFGSKNRNITLAGSWINNGTFTEGTGTVTFDGTSTISGSTTTTFYNIAITGNLTGHATDMNVSGNWTDNGTFTHNSGNVTFTGSTTLGGSSATSFCGVTITGILTGHPTNMNVACNWINNGTFNHNSGKVTFIGTSTLSGSSTSSFYDITITGALTGVSSGNFNVAGDWDNNGGTFTNNIGTVTFNGTTASAISNTGSGNFNNLTINNTSASDAVMLNNSITVDGMITFSDGHLVSSSSSPLIIETSGAVSGVSDASYVQGPVAKKTNSTANFVFPVGDNNSYRPIQITPTSANATTFTGRYYRAGQELGSGLGVGIDHISYWEYWEMERSTGTPADADVILTWDASSQVDNLTELRVVQFDGSNWIDKGNDATTGTAAAGTITINAVSTFTTKNFTFGSSTANNPLSMDRYTVVASGNWTDASTWAYRSGGTPGASVPGAAQNAIIEGGATISLTAETLINDLEIKTGNTVNGGGNKLNINGNLIVDGAYNSTGEIEYFGTSIDGSGTITLTGKELKVNTDGTVIEAGSNLTIANNLKINVNDIDITNYGTLTVTGDIKRQNGENIWINAANSVVNVSGVFMADNQIEASATPNTINFNGTGNQDVFMPVSSYHHVHFSGGGIKTLKQDTDINGDVTISTANFNTNNKNITLAGNWINNGTFTEGTGTVTFDGTSTISGSTTTTFYNIAITGNLTGHATDMNVSGNWTDNGTFTHNSGNVTFTGSTTLGGSSATSFCGVTITGILTGHPTNMNVACNWINNGTFNHNSGKVTFIGTSTLSGSSTSSFYDITITGALTGVSSGNFNVAGDWDNNGGTFTNNIGTVTFNGTTASAISNTGSGNFNNLTINNTSASDAVMLNNSITVDGMITFSDGHLVSSSSSPLIIETSGAVSGVSDASYVQGPVAKKTNSTANFVFPVGDNNSYRPIQITPTSANATTFTGRYYRAGQELGSGLGVGIDHISYWEYWEMERSTGTPADADVILTWDASSQVDNLTELRVVQFDGSNWIDKGNDATTGTAAAGTITINAVSTFTTKNFTFGSSTANNPLSMDRYTVSSGNWLNSNSWAYYSGGPSGASVPGAAQNAIIEGGATISQPANIEINNLEIKSGSTVNGIGIFTVYGDLLVDGTYSNSTGDIEYFGTSIDGSGTITLTGKKFKINTDGTVIEPGANLTLNADELKIDVNDIDITNYGTLTVTGDIKRQNGENIWINTANSVVNVGGVFMADNQIEASAAPNTINFNGTGNQDVFMPVSSYHHVQFSGGGIKTLKQDTDINGDVTISTAEFKANDRDITLEGNWINNGTFNRGNGTVTFDGTSTISGSTITTFNNVTVNTSGGILLATETKIAGVLTLTNGIISTDNTNILTIEDGGTSNDGSSNSFIDGPMKKIGDTDFTFPVGDGSVWAPVTISSIAGGSATTELTGEYFFTNPPNPTELPVSGIAYLSEIEYWDVDNNTTDVTSAEITLFWKDSDRSLISDIINGLSEDLIVAHYNAITPEWEPLNSLITIGSTTGPGGTGSVKATTTSFSPFTFASVFGNNSLPIELTYFTGIAEEDVVILKWETASEINNDYFTIERSLDGSNWEEIINVNGAGNSSVMVSYTSVDEDPYVGISYYRLKQTDYDGAYEYSKIISVNIDAFQDSHVVIYPNPANTQITIKGEIGELRQIRIYNLFGVDVTKLIKITKINKTNVTADLTGLSSGIYVIKTRIESNKIYKQ